MAEIRYQRERITDLWEQILPLLQAHHDEVVTEPDAPALDPDREQYDLIESVGRLRLYTARAGDELVGYASYLLATSMHSRGIPFAIHDVLYVQPSHRVGLTGAQLLLFADRELAREGCAYVRQSARPESTFGAVLCRLGYQLEEQTYVKRLRVPEAVA